MTAVRPNAGKASNKRKGARSDQLEAEPTSPLVTSERGENKVPYEAENIEHTIRRAMREKQKQRAKNPGHYL